MKHRHTQEGELLIDHRASPGISPELALSIGLDPNAKVGRGDVLEIATYTCCHCQTTVIKNPHRTRPRGYCAKCDHLICDSPGCIAECRSFEKLLDTLQNEAVKALNPTSLVSLT